MNEIKISEVKVSNDRFEGIVPYGGGLCGLGCTSGGLCGLGCN